MEISPPALPYTKHAQLTHVAGNAKAGDVAAIADNIQASLNGAFYHVFGIHENTKNDDEIEMRTVPNPNPDVYVNPNPYYLLPPLQPLSSLVKSTLSVSSTAPLQPPDNHGDLPLLHLLATFFMASLTLRLSLLGALTWLWSQGRE